VASSGEVPGSVFHRGGDLRFGGVRPVARETTPKLVWLEEPAPRQVSARMARVAVSCVPPVLRPAHTHKPEARLVLSVVPPPAQLFADAVEHFREGSGPVWRGVPVL